MDKKLSGEEFHRNPAVLPYSLAARIRNVQILPGANLRRDVFACLVLNIDLTSLGIDAPPPDYILWGISRTAFGSKLNGVTRIFVAKTLGLQAVRRKVIITMGLYPRRKVMYCLLLTNLIIGKARRWEE